jgi:4-hydroxybenzoate polyprenyltransferase
MLGPGLAYLLHTRPAEWPIMAAHTFLGYLLAVGLFGFAHRERLGSALLGLVVWVVGLNGGTLAVNSAFDRDEGDIAYLRNPPPAPVNLFAFGIGLMALGQLTALTTLPAAFAAVYALCFVLSILYSVPPIRLKAVAGADWLINMWGFGTFTPFAGWASTGLPLEPARGLVLLAFCPLFAALYPLTQIYQMQDDSRRGDRTLALRLGLQRSLGVALLCAGLAFALFVLAGIRAGWRLHTAADAARWAGVAIAASAWAVVLVPWMTQHAGMGTAAHQRRMYLALAAWAATDVVVILAWAT